MADGEPWPELLLSGEGALPSVFAVTDLAAASVAAAGRGVARLVSQLGGPAGPVAVDGRMASLWFRWTIMPDGWKLAPAWDAIAGDYETADGWIKLHTNAPHHRAAALAVLGVPAQRELVAAVVAGWPGAELETAVVEGGGCAAAMASVEEWALHPQGVAVGSEPTVDLKLAALAHRPDLDLGSGPGLDYRRPLAGVRVLDLTRVLAGPIATRFLAGLGADVIRIDPPSWNEPGVVPEVTRGKRCGRLDLTEPEHHEELQSLLAEAHIMVHGYRPGALDRLGLGAEERQALAPGLVDVSLDAYGWTGPMAGRRGFDSLVQMSSGIAEAAMTTTGADRPTPLPVQALDHATGYLVAATALHGFVERLRSGRGFIGRTSLARTAKTLVSGPRTDIETDLEPAGRADVEEQIEQSAWGPARRLRPPVQVEGAPLRWDLPATELGSEPRPLAWRSDDG
ncbi:MAG: acyl-CoA transferase [Actinomycetia bacterium]|nr:acyl-CoA transferase [Actinomycetes bacterium]MCP4227100.1 acyl-CoA transferase [Actinomycetes bacterium]MCP5030376.1 acyl-CoA transferase [Actinomycetes bacterium]